MRSFFARKATALALSTVLLTLFAVPTSAFFRLKKSEPTAASELTRNVLVGDTLQFSPEDFHRSGGSDTVSSITINSLPDRSCGILSMGTQPLEPGAVIRITALDGLRFQAMNAPRPYYPKD